MKLIDYRKAHGMNQRQFAAIVGRSQGQVCQWEQGISIPDVQALDAIFIVTGGLVTANDFHNQKPVPKAPVRLLRKLGHV